MQSLKWKVPTYHYHSRNYYAVRFGTSQLRARTTNLNTTGGTSQSTDPTSLRQSPHTFTPAVTAQAHPLSHNAVMYSQLNYVGWIAPVYILSYGSLTSWVNKFVASNSNRETVRIFLSLHLQYMNPHINTLTVMLYTFYINNLFYYEPYYTDRKLRLDVRILADTRLKAYKRWCNVQVSCRGEGQGTGPTRPLQHMTWHHWPASTLDTWEDDVLGLEGWLQGFISATRRRHSVSATVHSA